MAHGIVLRRAFSVSSANLASVIKNVTVIGGGLMGSGIAQVAAQTGHKVTLVETSPELLQKANERIHTNVQRIAKKRFKDSPSDEMDAFVKNTMNNITGTTDVQQAAKQSDLILEAIVENIAAKHELFRKVDDVAPAHTLFASNTSSLSIAEIGSACKRQDKFGGLHFFNPVPLMKLLEVVRSDKTSDDTYTAFMEWGKALGKTCITCKDTPGFVVNRLLVPYVAEAVRMLERGDASATDIDIAMKLGAGFPMGPIELADYVGNDTTCFILQGWQKKYPNIKLFEAPEMLIKLVEQNKLGVKTGEGFYKYNK